MANILVDVDNTVVDPTEMWWKWLCGITKTKKPFPSGDNIDHALGNYFEDELEGTAIDPLDFWRANNVYDFLFPIAGSVVSLYSLKQKGHKIIFVSHCKGFHMKSKYKFLERWFPVDGFHATKEKSQIMGDIVIDDRNKIFNQFDDRVLKLKHVTPYSQCEELKAPVTEFTNWCTIPRIIEEYLST